MDYLKVLQELGEAVTIATGVAKCYNGQPVWGRPEVKLPAAAVELGSLQAGRYKTVSMRMATPSPVYYVYVQGRDEIQMVKLINSLVGWLQESGWITVDSHKYSVDFVDGVRLKDETDALDAQYRYQLQVLVSPRS